MDLKRKIQTYLIPKKENDFEPHIFRNAGIIFLATIALIVFLATVFGRIYVDISGLRANVLSSLVFDLTNKARSENNISGLAYNTTLELAAKMKANDMVTKNYFAHTSPEGLTPWYWFKEAGYNYFYAGENLAVDFDDSEMVTEAWMASPTHRANILNGKFNEIGIATAQGTYKGHTTTFVVQMFGSRAVSLPKEIIAPSVVSETMVKEVEVVKEKENPEVKGESIEEPIKEEEIKNGESDFVFTQTSEKNVIPNTEIKKENIIPKSGSALDLLVVSPEKGMELIYIIIGVIIFIGIVFRISVEYKRHHIKHVFLGIAILLLLIGLFFLYKILFGFSQVIVA